MSLIDAYKNQPIDQMLALLEEIMGLVTTNMDNSEIVGLVWELFPMIASAEYKTQVRESRVKSLADSMHLRLTVPEQPAFKLTGK